MAEPGSAAPPEQGPGPGDQAPVAHGTRSRGDLSSAEAGAGAVHGSVPSAVCAQSNMQGTSSNTILQDSGNSYEPYQHATAAAEAQRSRAGDASSDHDQHEQVNQHGPQAR